MNQKDMNKIKEDIGNICSQFAFEFNNQQTRNKMCDVLSSYLEQIVVDETTPKQVDLGGYSYCVLIDGVKYSLTYYIDNIVMIDRKHKMKKIINRINENRSMGKF